MVLALRALMFVGLLVWWLSKLWRGRKEQRLGQTFRVRVEKQKGQINWIHLSLPTRLGARFSFDREGKLDVWLRAVGLVTEVQTNDRGFDDKVFVACDDEAVHAQLKSDARLRTTIVDVMDQYGRIHSGGRHVHLSRPSHELPTDEDFQTLARVVAMLDAVQRPGRRLDPFLWRVVLVEVVFGVLLAYGLGGIPDIVNQARVALTTRDLVVAGLATTACLAAVGAVFLALVARGSSRVWRVVADGLFLLVFSAPLGGFALAAELNTRLDGPPVVVPLRIESMHTEQHQTKHGVRTSFHVEVVAVDPATSPVVVPRHVEIPEHVSAHLRTGEVVKSIIGRGALRVPYWISFEG